jgi:hypothetical protein
VVRFRVAPSSEAPGGWISERGRYSRHPYRIADPIAPPPQDVCAEVSGLSIAVSEPVEADRAAPDAGAKKPERLASRFKMLQSFNSLMMSTIPLVDLSLVGKPWSIATLVSGCR